MDALYGRCPMCQGKTSVTIDEVVGTENGYIVNGRIICNSCGQFFDLGNSIEVELKELVCPSCKNNTFDKNYDVIREIDGGYKFTATLQCKNLKCNWRKRIISNVQYVNDIITRLKTIQITVKDGFKIETHPP